jgi:hypothetical protein
LIHKSQNRQAALLSTGKCQQGWQANNEISGQALNNAEKAIGRHWAMSLFGQD